MYSKLDIELIRIFGRKELTKGCLIKIKGDNWIRVSDYAEISANHGETDAVLVLYSVTGKGVGEIKMHAWLYPEEEEYKTLEILGHIPHLEDVFRVAEEMGFGDIYISSYRNDDGGSGYIRKRIQIKDNVFFYNPTLPLLEQSEETKQALITLFEQGK